MKASLQLNMSHQLTMTPQLQQAIKLLQLSHLELQQEIQEALDGNPLLEVIETDNEQYNEQDFSVRHDEDTSKLETFNALEKKELSDDLPVDSSWDDHYSSGPSNNSTSSSASDIVYQGETEHSLQSHLLWQMELSPFTDEDRAIAISIIDSIDELGFLHASLEEILAAQGDEELELAQVETVLKRIQHFDPLGIAARSLSECLMIQLSQYNPANTTVKDAKLLLEQFSQELSIKDFRSIQKKSALKPDNIKYAIELLQSLNPKPGSMPELDKQDYVIPDVSVSKQKGRWVVELNPDYLPKLGVNQQYAHLAKGNANAQDAQFVKGHLQEAKWFIKSLESRHDTLLKVARCIVQLQQDFFEYGPEAMKPMVLNDVAEYVELHESTISRVTSQKYMHTPKGIFELKYFFSSHVATDTGGECSSTAIRAFIKKLVQAENSKKPLSDNKIAKLLEEQGINVARRTIAKYRESMHIPPSNQRKTL